MAWPHQLTDQLPNQQTRLLSGNGTRLTPRMMAFWDTVPCSLLETDRRFRVVYCLHHSHIALKMKAVSTSETSVYYNEAISQKASYLPAWEHEISPLTPLLQTTMSHIHQKPLWGQRSSMRLCEVSNSWLPVILKRISPLAPIIHLVPFVVALLFYSTDSFLPVLTCE
jgi:hypothetical protein